MARVDLLLTGIGELVTHDPVAHGAPSGLVRDAALVIADGRVTWAGSRLGLPAALGDVETIDCGGRAVVPGFVDAHTHLVFGGHRADEFARRLHGASYAQVLAAGGGIHASVAATRLAATVGEPGLSLLDQSLARARRMVAFGTTTVEVKSGYGLDTAGEQRMLEVANELPRHAALDVVPTFLGAHVVPGSHRADRDGYLALLEDEMLPACAPLARYCDVFCEEGAFSVDEARRVLLAGKRHGLAPRIHANQLGASGGARLAAEVGAISADHLDHVDDGDIAALRAAGTVAVLLPGAALSMRAAPPPARRLWDAGVPVAIATDCNPGTSYVESMQLVIALAVLELGLAPEEALWSATRGGARALELTDRGWLGAGSLADLVILDADSHLHLSYRPGSNLAWKVMKRGRVVYG